MTYKYGTVIIDSNPRGATVYIDGEILIDPDTEESIKTPAKVNMIEGRRDIVIKMNKYDDCSVYVDVIPGSIVSKNCNLKLSSGSTLAPRIDHKVFGFMGSNK